MFQAAERSPQRLQTLLTSETCAQCEPALVWREQDTRGESANTDVLCKCHSGCTVAVWGWGATLTELASDSLGTNMHMSGLLTVIPWLLLLFLREQKSRLSCCWVVGLLRPLRLSWCTGRSPDIYSVLYRQPSSQCKCGAEPAHPLLGVACKLPPLQMSSVSFAQQQEKSVNYWLLSWSRLRCDWLGATGMVLVCLYRLRWCTLVTWACPHLSC